MPKPFSRLVVVGLLVGVPLTAHAQEAVVSGTMTDSTGGVLPGVTVTAVHEDGGNTFVGVTDDRGMFRLPVRTGLHRLTLELAGFGTVARSIDLLVNQQAVVNLQMAPSTLRETVTVTGEAPLIDTTKSEVGGNIDPRQLQDLPVNGRNWLDLATLAPGSRQNSSSDTLGGKDYQFQINIDGQQVTQLFSGAFGQPRYSREAIAEFQFVSNRFDASQSFRCGTTSRPGTLARCRRSRGPIASASASSSSIPSATSWRAGSRMTGPNVGSASNSRVKAVNPDGSLQLVARRSFGRPSLHRVDTRLQKRFRFGDRTIVDGMLEVFNLFNHENFNSFVTNLSNTARYGQPSQDTNIAFQPRMLQLGFRLSF